MIYNALNQPSRKEKILVSNLTLFHLIVFDFVMVQVFFPYFVSTNLKSILLLSLLILFSPKF